MEKIDIIICLKKINTKTYMKKIKIKKENMEKIDIIICLKKRRKIKRIPKKTISRSKKSLDIIMNKIVFFNNDLIVYLFKFMYSNKLTIKFIYSNKLTKIKAYYYN